MGHCVVPALLVVCEPHQVLIQQRARVELQTTRDVCDVQPFPCDNDLVDNFPLQAINSQGNDCPIGVSTISKLNLDTGIYTALCEIPAVCLNACGLSPVDHAIYCEVIWESAPPAPIRQFARVNCPFDPANQAATVAGSLCYFGTIAASFAGAFDAAGTYYYRNGPLVRAITAAEIAGFVGDANPITGATQQVRDVENAGNTIRQVNAPPSPLNSLSDFVVAGMCWRCLFCFEIGNSNPKRLGIYTGKMCYFQYVLSFNWWFPGS